MKKIIECVPNFSEGNDQVIIDQIVDAIKAVKGVEVVDVDPGKATNRTVVTVVGAPDEVCDAVFLGIQKAKSLINMAQHKGAHPRFGATDVCPLIPVANISMEETIVLARKLAERVGNELGIPVYCYEAAAFKANRKNLANCRSGEYEALPVRLVSEEWKPDFGPAVFSDHVAKSGAIAVGARNFLIAYNINLNTTSTRRANAVAFDIREKGRVKREGDAVTGKVINDEQGRPLFEPGLLKSVKAIGWYIEEYGIAQISMNLTDLEITSLHQAFELTCEQAHARGMRVTGSELVGVVPLQAMLEAGKYFLRKQNRSTGIPDAEIIKIAIKSLGLDELYPFEPESKIIEYIIAKKGSTAKKRLVGLNLSEFAEETSSESPAPGGGSISAYIGALGVSLGGMVANLSAHKRGWDHRWEEFSAWAEKAKDYQTQLLTLVDEDTKAFNGIMDAFSLPKINKEDVIVRQQAIETATKYAIEVPLQIMKISLQSMEVMQAMVLGGNPNSISDAVVGAIAAKAAVFGAYYNVIINTKGLSDENMVEGIVENARLILSKTKVIEEEILKQVDLKI